MSFSCSTSVLMSLPASVTTAVGHVPDSRITRSSSSGGLKKHAVEQLRHRILHSFLLSLGREAFLKQFLLQSDKKSSNSGAVDDMIRSGHVS